jgi:hypothetical protein
VAELPTGQTQSPVYAVVIYAAYGEALYLAQSMEMGMRIFYYLDKTLPTTPPGKSPRMNLDDEPLADINMNSLGGFIRRFRRELFEEGEIDPEMRNLMKKLEQSVDDRNRLVHTYWWERSLQFETDEGRAAMLAELNEMITRFRLYDQVIRRMVLTYLVHYNLDPLKITSDKFQGWYRQAKAL